MNGKERLTTVFRSEIADRVPWTPLIDESTLTGYPPEIRDAGIIRFTKEIGGDILYRAPGYTIRNDAVDLLERNDAHHIWIKRRTKVGCLSETRRGGRILEYPIKTLGDYEIMEYILDHQVCEPDYPSLLEREKEVGEDGIVSVWIGENSSQGMSPIQSLIEAWMGLSTFCSHFARYRNELENLMNLMHEKNKEIYHVAAESPERVAILCEDTSTTLISPWIYEKYSLKHVNDFVDIMHSHYKVAMVHMCGKINALLSLIKQTGLDGIDCLTSRPVGDVDFRRMYEIFGDEFIVHGILDACKWLPDPRTSTDIERSIEEILAADILCRPFIFCTAADGIPGVPIEKFKAIGRIMQKYNAEQATRQIA